MQHNYVINVTKLRDIFKLTLALNNKNKKLNR